MTWLGLLLAAATVACDPGAGIVSQPPSRVCVTLAARCQLDGGPLGVCESAPCPPGASPPCLTCVSQH